MRAAVALLLLGACGFGGSSTGIDAAAVDSSIDSPGPVMVDAPAPDMALGDWSTPILVNELAADGVTDDPTLTDDQLMMFFSSSRTGSTGEDIYMAQRSSAEDPWGLPTRVSELSSIVVDSNVEVSGDGLTITFTSNRNITFDLYVATRTARDQVWSNPAPILGLKDDASSEFGGHLIDDGKAIYFCSDRGADEKIYFAQRPNLAAAFGEAQAVPGIDSLTNECDAFLVDRTLYFTRDTGDVTPRDIYRAERTPMVPFAYDAPVLVGAEISLIADDSDPWVSPDQRTMYFVSDRGGAPAIYLTTR